MITKQTDFASGDKIHGKTTHGLSGHRKDGKRVGVSSVYRTWQNMRQRCNNSKIWSWQYYGGRGIKVCERWNKFENFYKDMGEKPTPQHTLERKDTNGDYSPFNCVWESKKVQCRNKRVNHFETYDGRTLSVAEWSELYKIPYTTLMARLTRLGWSVERALTEAVK